MRATFHRLLFLAFLVSSISAELEEDWSSVTRAVPDNPACPKDEKCTTEADCDCKVAFNNSTQKLFEGFKRFCTNKLCEYCIERPDESKRSQCAFGDSANPTTLKYEPCCRALAVKDMKYSSKPNEAISCIPGPVGRDRKIPYLCQAPCGPISYGIFYAPATCQDKNGYTPNVNFKGKCAGTKPDTWTVCQNQNSRPKECGITGAKCANDAECCNGFKCDESSCAIRCTGEGETCGISGTPGCCLTYFGRKLICKKQLTGDPKCMFQDFVFDT